MVVSPVLAALVIGFVGCGSLPNIPLAPFTEADSAMYAPDVSISIASGSAEIPEGKTAVLEAYDYSYSSGSISWSWMQNGGPEVGLRGADTESCSFVAPPVDGEAEITISVTATNERGSSTATQVMRIISSDVLIPPPVVEASVKIDQASNYGYGFSADTAEVDSTVTMTASAHPQGHGENQRFTYYENGQEFTDLVNYSFEWVQTAGPDIQLSADDIKSPSFVVPALETLEAATFLLTATDSEGRTATTTVSINLSPVPEPEADALLGGSGGYWTGTDRSFKPNETVTLGESVYKNVTLGAKGAHAGITFDWVQTDGPDIDITGADEREAKFVAPCVTSTEVATFELTVTDRLGRTDSSSVDVKLAPAAPPTASAGSDQAYWDYPASNSYSVPEIIQLKGAGSNGDATNNTQEPSFHWEQVSGKDVEIQDANRAEAYFEVPGFGLSSDPYGDYGFKLTVTDACGLSKTSLVKVSLKSI